MSMRRSPYCNQSKYDRPKRDYRQREPDDRQYDEQSRKRVHLEQTYSRPQDQQRRQSRNQENKTIRIEHKQPIQVKINKPTSQLRTHFRFNPISIAQKREQQLINRLKEYISSNAGPIQFFQKSQQSQPGHLIMLLGFRYDEDAFNYLTNKYSSLDVNIDGKFIYIASEPSKSFKLLINESRRQNESQKPKKRSRSKSKGSRQKKSKRKRAKESRSKSSSNESRKSRRSRRSKDSRRQKHRHSRMSQEKSRRNPRQDDQTRRKSRNSSEKDKRRQKKYSPQQRRRQQQKTKSSNIIVKSQQQKKTVKKPRRLCFYAVHHSINSKEITNYLQNHKQGPFKALQPFCLKRVTGSISQYMVGFFDERDALRLVSLAQNSKIEIRDRHFIIFECQSDQNQKILQKLSAFQVNIEFPKHVEPYHLVKALKQFGNVVQVVSNTKLSSEGCSANFNVTFNSQQTCKKLIYIHKTRQGIFIEQVKGDEAVLVYRPNYQTDLNIIKEQKTVNQSKVIERQVSPQKSRQSPSSYYRQNRSHSRSFS